jgi:hypothetical protein
LEKDSTKWKWTSPQTAGQDPMSSGSSLSVSSAFDNHLFIAIPMIIFYVFGCPIVAFVILYKNRNRLDDPKVLRYIILLYQGLRHEVYYWELVNTLRK